jgi:Zn-dependent protease with chaperone function
MKLRTIISLGVSLLLLGCATVEETGRQRLSIVSDQQLIAASNQEFARLHQKLISENRILRGSESPEAARTLETIRRVANRVIDASGHRNRVNWEIIVVKAKEANAMVLPNGKILVFTGLLPVAANDAGLAAIIGHEIAHVVAAHAAERIGQVMLADVGLKVIDKILENRNSKHRPAVNSALGFGVQYGLLLPFSREHELEADRMGMLFMAKAGYDPSEAARVWERMQRRGGGNPWEFLSTHPSNTTRQAKLREFEPEARQVFLDRSKSIVAQRQPSLTIAPEKAKATPVAFQPTLKDGFWYKTKFQDEPNPTTFSVKIKNGCAGANCTQIVGDNGLTVNLGEGLATISTEFSPQSWTRYTPALRQVNFPLAVGNNWKDDVEIKYSDGKTEQATFQFTVTAYETVKVVDAEFMAFRIAVLKNGTKFRDGWYAPETGTFVMVEFFDQGKISSTLRLVDYQKEVDMSGGLANNTTK